MANRRYFSAKLF